MECNYLVALMPESYSSECS